jgi:hypothetical protein
MKPAFWARSAHKWIGLVIGVQALLWMISGLYMTAISIDIIHGDHLAQMDTEPVSASGGIVSSNELVQRYPGLQGFRLKHFMGKDVYEVHYTKGTELVDAQSGASLGALDEATARQRASALYHGAAPLTSMHLLHQAPQEVATRPVPMWQANFGDRGETTLYISPHTGELLAKRHSLWRMYDFLWMFHIMDYEKRADVNNTLLRVAASVGVAFALSGVWLLFYSFRRRKAA